MARGADQPCQGPKRRADRLGPGNVPSLSYHHLIICELWKCPPSWIGMSRSLTFYLQIMHGCCHTATQFVVVGDTRKTHGFAHWSVPSPTLNRREETVSHACKTRFLIGCWYFLSADQQACYTTNFIYLTSFCVDIKFHDILVSYIRNIGQMHNTIIWLTLCYYI